MKRTRLTDPQAGEKVHLIDAYQGDRSELGRGSKWTEVGNDLLVKI